MRQRGLTPRAIETAIAMPDRLVPSFKGRAVARKRIGGRTLEVVYKRLNGSAVIITAYWLEEEA